MKVIDPNNLPGRLPLFPSMTTFLFLSHFNCPEWVYGAVGLLFAAWWGGSISRMARQHRVDLFATAHSNDEKPK